MEISPGLRLNKNKNLGAKINTESNAAIRVEPVY